MGYTTDLARFCADLRLSEVPPDVREIARSCVLDFLGCILGTVVMEEETRRLDGLIRSLGEREEATVLGLGLRTSCRSAALAHGALAEMLEFQDTYACAAYHPASSVMPAALAVAEVRRSSGRDLLAAVIAGYEASMRIGAAVGQSTVENGFMTTGTLGTFGAAIAAGKLMGLDSTGLAHALGIAGYMLPFSMAEISLGGYTVRTINGGHAARTGIEAAQMAAQGYTGSHQVLEGSANPRWGFCAMAGGTYDLDRINERLGDCYYLREISFKMYPCCGLPTTAVEATIDLATRFKLKPADVDSVLVRTYGSAASRVGQNYPSSSSSFTACQFSMPYLLASAIKHGQMGLPQFSPESIGDPEVQQLSSRVRTVESKELTQLAEIGARPSIVEITLKNGGCIRSRVDFRKGDPGRPMCEEELMAKFQQLATLAVDEAAAGRVQQLILGLEDIEDVSELVRLLAGPTANR